MAAPHGTRRLLGHPEEEARADHCFGQRGTRTRLPHQRLGKPVKPAINDASARRDSGGPSSVPSRGGDSENRPRAVRTLSRSNVKLPNWSIGRRRIYERLGANYIAPDRLRVSVAIRSEERRVGKEC